MSEEDSKDVLAHEEVLRYVYSFLDGCGYRRTLLALQAESGVAYNTIVVKPEKADTHDDPPRKQRATASWQAASPAGLERAVLEGSWAEVLTVYVDGLLLPHEVKLSLYERVLEEMLQLHGLQPAARALLHNAPIFLDARHQAPARYARLEQMVEHFDPLAWHDATRHGDRAALVDAEELRQRREAILRQLRGAIRFADAIAAAGNGAPDTAGGALPAALLLWLQRQQQRGGRGKRARSGESHAEDEGYRNMASASKAADMTVLEYPIAAPRRVRVRVACGVEKALCTCAAVSRAPRVARGDDDGGGGLLLLGRADGVLDCVRVPPTGKEDGGPVVLASSPRHSGGVLCMALDRATLSREAPNDDEAAQRTSTWVALGYRDGWVKVYNGETCKLVRRLGQVHAMAVTTLAFTGPRSSSKEVGGGHHTLLVSGSYDTTLLLLSVYSGTVLCKVTDAHRGAFVNALCPLVVGSASTGGGGDCEALMARDMTAVMSAGNDGTLSCWCVTEQLVGEDVSYGLTRLGQAVGLRAIHRAAQKDDIVTTLHRLCDDGDVDMTERNEILVLTRSATALLIAVDVPCASRPVTLTALCVLTSTRSLRFGDNYLTRPVSLPCPMLTLLLSDEEGTVVLFNVKMVWRDAEQWARFGGTVRVNEPTDSSPVVIVEHGRSIADLHLCCLPQPAGALDVVAYAPSLPSFYVLRA